jgi:hypothetical protein
MGERAAGKLSPRRLSLWHGSDLHQHEATGNALGKNGTMTMDEVLHKLSDELVSVAKTKQLLAELGPKLGSLYCNVSEKEPSASMACSLCL